MRTIDDHPSSKGSQAGQCPSGAVHSAVASAAEVTAVEHRLVETAVKHVLRRVDWPLQEYLRDDARQVASIAMFLLRATLVRLPEAERAPYATASLRHELFHWTKYELRQKRQADAYQDEEEHEDRPQGPADVLAAAWEELIARSVLDVPSSEHVAAAIRALPVRDQQALNLYYFIGLSDAETAQRRGCSTETVKSRRNRAVKKLQRHLGIEEHGGSGASTSGSSKKFGRMHLFHVPQALYMSRRRKEETRQCETP
jgi:RNA polymerase sigma factor (sigma-70 family)